MSACVVDACGAPVYAKTLCKPHYMLAWRKKNRAHHDAYMWMYGLRRRHGMTVEEFTALRERQGDVCAVCSQSFRSTRDCHVDHDHSTGKIRGLLCHACNTGIGSLGDDAERLRLAIAYLERGE